MKKIIQKIILLLLLVSPLASYASIGDVFTMSYTNNPSNSSEFASTTLTGRADTGYHQGNWTGTNYDAAVGYFRYSPVVGTPPIYCNDLYGSNMVATKEFWISGGAAGFSIQLDNLEPDTQYSFCAVASNDASIKTDIKYGGVITFTTLPCSVCQQVNVTTSQAFVTNQSNAYINGLYNSTKASKTYFEYKKDMVISPPQTWTKVGTQTHPAGASGNINFSLNNLSASTSYKYRAVIEARKPDATCTSQSLTIPCYEAPIYGVDKDFTTIAAPVTIVTTNPGVTYGNTGWSNVWNGGNTGNTTNTNYNTDPNGGNDTNPNCPQFKVNPISDQLVLAGSNLVFNASICGSVEGAVSYTARDVPTGATFSSEGRFSWTPTTSQVGVYTVTINAASGALFSGGTAVKIYVINQINNGTRLTIYPLPAQNVPALSTVAFSVNSYNAQGKPVSYSSSNVPTGAIFSRDGTFEWTPEIAQVGVYTMTINASTEIDRALPINVLISVTDINNIHYIDVDPINPICLATSPNYDPTNPICHISNYTNFCVATSPNYDPTNPICNSTEYANLCLPTSPNYSPSSPICTGYDYNNNTNNGNNNGNGTSNGNNVQYDYSGYTGIPFTGSGTIGGGIFGSSNTNGGGINNGNGSNSGNTNGGNSNGGNSNNGNNGNSGGGMVPPPKVGSYANPLSDAIVHYHEGVETVFTRQIMHYPGFAKLYGYVDGENLQHFADTLSHTFAQIFGYYAGGGREIRVTVPDMAAYEFGLKDGMLAVYEYYDNHLTGISVVTGKLKSAFEYEYYYTKR